MIRVGAEELTLAQWIDRDIRYWLDQCQLGISIHTITENADGSCEVRLADEEDDDISIGNYGRSGITICEVGEITIAAKQVQLVSVNSVVIQAASKHVVAWIHGYNIL